MGKKAWNVVDFRAPSVPLRRLSMISIRVRRGEGALRRGHLPSPMVGQAGIPRPHSSRRKTVYSLRRPRSSSAGRYAPPTISPHEGTRRDDHVLESDFAAKHAPTREKHAHASESMPPDRKPQTASLRARLGLECARVNLPELHHAVITTAGQDPSVGREGQRADRLRVAGQRSSELTT